MNELERRLVALGAEIEYPQAPRFDYSFTERAPRRRSRWRPLAVAFAALVLIAAGVLTFSDGARSAFLEIFHIRGATVERVEELPDVRGPAVRLRRAGHAARRPSGAPASSSSTWASPTRSSSATATSSRSSTGPSTQPRLVLTAAPRQRLARFRQEGRPAAARASRT